MAIRTRGGPLERTYRSWQKMKDRCTNPKASTFPRYGGRGIGFDQRWHSFETFLADMGVRPAGKSLDRIDNNGGYSPDNCRWATQSEQVGNTRRSRRISYQGRTQCVTHWSRELGIPVEVLRSRIKRGWSPARAFTRPVGKTSKDKFGRYSKE